MKKNTLKKVLPIFLCSMVSFTACNTGSGAGGANNGDFILLTDENRDSVKYTTAKTWEHEEVTDYLSGAFANLGEDVMPIFGMWSPWDTDVIYGGQRIPNLATDEMYKQIAETGINVLWQGNENWVNDKQKVSNALDLAAKYGMVLSVMDGYYWTWGAHAASGTFLHEDQTKIHVTQEQFTQRLKEYAYHPGFGGLYFIDEPNPYLYPSFKTLTEMYYTALEELGVGRSPAYWNSFPTGYLVRNYGYDYERHLKEFGLASGYVCFDNYPFMWGMPDDFSHGWFSNLNQAYDVARENNLPFGAYIATGGNWSGIWDDNTGVKAATIEQTVWQVNMLIAYGAKTVHWFTLNQPISNLNDHETGGSHGCFDSFGNKTRFYYAAQQVNSQILACDHILLKSKQHGVISMGKLMGDGNTSSFRNLIKENQFRELVSVNEDAQVFIGCFDYQGKTMLYVVNGSFYDKSEITLGFDDTYRFEVTQRAEMAEIVAKKFTLKLSPGESAMVLLK